MTETVDSSGNGYNATIVGRENTHFFRGEESLTGDCGFSLKLDGGYIDIVNAANSLSSTNVFSGVLFLKFDTPPSGDWFAEIISISNSDDSSPKFRLFYTDTTLLPTRYWIQLDGTGEIVSLDAASINITSPHMLYFEVDYANGSMKLNVNNGEFEQVETGLSLVQPVFGTQAFIGTRSSDPESNGEFNFYGWLDEVAFFNKVLTEEELTSIRSICSVATRLTWSTTSKNNSIVLSSDDTFAETDTGGSWAMVIATLPRDSGKYYFSLRGAFAEWGGKIGGFISADDFNDTDYPGSSVSKGLGWANSNPMYLDGGSFTADATWGTGLATLPITIAVDMDNKTFRAFRPDLVEHPNTPASYGSYTSVVPACSIYTIGETCEILGDAPHFLVPQSVLEDGYLPWLEEPSDYKWSGYYLNAEITLSESDYQANCVLTSSNVRIVKHPRSRHTGKYSVRWMVQANTTEGVAVGFTNNGSYSVGSYLGATSNGWALIVDSTSGKEYTAHNGVLTDLGNLASFATEAEVGMDIDLDTGDVFIVVNGTYLNSGAAVFTGATGTAANRMFMVADLKASGHVRILRPNEFITPTKTGYTAGWS